MIFWHSQTGPHMGDIGKTVRFVTKEETRVK